jgi:CheY-like chemotaxis protein
MPMMDGFEVCKIMRKMIQDETLSPLNIVAVTAGLSEEQLNRC